jgi:hypothetical protein
MGWREIKAARLVAADEKKKTAVKRKKAAELRKLNI